MEDDLHVDKLPAAHVDIHIGTEEFFGQHGDVETIGIEAGQVASFDVVGYAACHFLESGTIGHVGIVYAMHSRGFGRDVHFGIDTHGFGLLIPVGIYLEVTDFDNSVWVDIGTRSLQIKKDYRIFQIQFHCFFVL